MRTKLSILCDKVIEAGWLAAVVVVPLAFNVYSQRTFEPDKITLLRSIALVMALAWLIKVIEAGGQRKNQPLRKRGLAFLRIPLVMPALLVALIYLFTTITSIVPRLSFWGSYQRLQGTYTTLSYLVIFFLSLQTLRTREQLERLIAVILLTSLPISLYGIMQHYSLDPIAWSTVGESVALRVISTMGNPIFVAAYLIMVAPLIISQLAQLSFLSTNERGLKHYLLAGYYALLLAVQLLCIFFTQSRGPLLGLLGGIFFFFLLLAIVRGKKQSVLAVVAVAILLGLFLLILNLPHSPLEPIRRLPYVGRLSCVFDTQSRTGRQRILAWEGTVNLITADPVRTLIGYGPESMIVAFNPHFPPDLASLITGATFDRSHNETLDVLAMTGLIGLAVYLFLFGNLFYYDLKWLGLIQGSRQRRVFLCLWLGGGLAGALLPWFLEGKWRFSGVGLPLGMIAGSAIYLVLYPLPRLRKEDAGELHRSIILAALLSAIMAHFIEIQFGIAIVATRTYFWLYAALVIVIGFYGRGLVPAGARVPVQTTPRRRARRRRAKRGQPPSRELEHASIVSISLLTGLIMATLAFSFPGFQLNLQGRGISILALLFAVWLMGGLTLAVRSSHSVKAEDSFVSYPLLSVGWFFLFVLGHWFSVQPNSDPAGALVVYYVYLFLTMGAIAATLLREKPLPSPLWCKSRGWFYPVLIIAVMLLISVTNLDPIKADIYYKQGMSYADNRQWDSSIASFQRALKLAPDQDFYYIFLAGAYVEKAKAASSADEKAAWLEEGRKALERGKDLNPLNPDHTAKLGLLHRVWGEVATEPAERRDKLRQAVEYYGQAAELSPNSLPILTEWGQVYHLLGEYDKAIEKYQRALQLNRRYPKAYLLVGDTYVAMGELDQAAEAYRQVVELDAEGALQLKRRAVEEAPGDYVGHQSLALLYEQLGRMNLALSEATRARDLAPASKKSDLERFMAHLEKQQK